MATYNVTNTSDVTLPYMWSQHALLAVAPGDDIVLPGVERVSVTHLKSEGATRAATTIAWPDHELNLAPRRLDAVVGPDARFAGKFYARVDRPFCASIGNATGRLELSWDAEILPYVGIWLNYGAWPINEQSSHHIAIEPTTAPVDSLAEAIAAGSQVQLPARGSHSWSTTLRLLGAAC